MRETFYSQIREFGILIETTNIYEYWKVYDCDIIVYFSDKNHKIIESIIL